MGRGAGRAKPREQRANPLTDFPIGDGALPRKVLDPLPPVHRETGYAAAGVAMSLLASRTAAASAGDTRGPWNSTS